MPPQHLTVESTRPTTNTSLSCHGGLWVYCNPLWPLHSHPSGGQALDPCSPYKVPHLSTHRWTARGSEQGSRAHIHYTGPPFQHPALCQPTHMPPTGLEAKTSGGRGCPVSWVKPGSLPRRPGGLGIHRAQSYPGLLH